ncbi:MAG TPA: hypothetical protein VNE62_01860 [Actinomycetota bacterium]|nr:hypothetical protein [Actinomycetota bacterium]
MSAMRRPVQLRGRAGRDQIRLDAPEADLVSISQMNLERDLEGADAAISSSVLIAEQDLVTRTWFHEANRRRAHVLLGRLEKAVASGRLRRAEHVRMLFLAAVQGDRVARAKAAARRRGLRMERAGRGPLLDHPVLHQQRRLAWRIYPLEGFHGIELPERAARVKAAWDTEGGVFDRYYLADEVPEPASAAVGRLVTLHAAKAGSAAAVTAGRSAATGAGRAAGALAGAAGRVASAIVSAPALASAATSRAIVMPDPCLIGVISPDGRSGEWFILDRWRH